MITTIKHKYNIGDKVKTKSNGELKVTGMNIYLNENKQCIQYQLDGIRSIFFHEEDLKGE